MPIPIKEQIIEIALSGNLDCGISFRNQRPIISSRLVDAELGRLSLLQWSRLALLLLLLLLSLLFLRRRTSGSWLLLRWRRRYSKRWWWRYYLSRLGVRRRRRRRNEVADRSLGDLLPERPHRNGVVVVEGHRRWRGAWDIERGCLGDLLVL